MARQFVLSLDLGGAELKHVLFDLETGRMHRAHPNPRGPFYRLRGAADRRILDTVLPKVGKTQRLSRHVRNETARVLKRWRCPPDRVVAVGISVAGKVFSNGRGRRAATFIGGNTPKRFAGRDRFGQAQINVTGDLLELFPDPAVEVGIANDCNCTGVAQAMVYEKLGHAPRQTFFITMGQGFGGGGAFEDVDEVGHMKVDGLHPALHLECGCGEWNCIEAFASGTGFPKFTRRLLELRRTRPRTLDAVSEYERLGGRLDGDLAALIDASPLRKVKDLRAEHVFKHARLGHKRGDGFARYIVGRCAGMAGTIIASVANVHGLTVFGLGGGVARHNPAYVGMMDEAANNVIGKASKFSPKRITVELSPLGKVANDYGPACLVVPDEHKPAWVQTMTDLARKMKR